VTLNVAPRTFPVKTTSICAGVVSGWVWGYWAVGQDRDARRRPLAAEWGSSAEDRAGHHEFRRRCGCEGSLPPSAWTPCDASRGAAAECAGRFDILEWRSKTDRLAVWVHKPGMSAWRAQATLALARLAEKLKAATRCSR